MFAGSPRHLLGCQEAKRSAVRRRARSGSIPCGRDASKRSHRRYQRRGIVTTLSCHLAGGVFHTGQPANAQAYRMQRSDGEANKGKQATNAHEYRPDHERA